MDEVLGQRHSTTPPVLIAYIPEDTPVPNTTVDDQEEESQPEPLKRKRVSKRERERG